MDLEIKLLQLPDRGNHLIVIARGLIDMEGLEWIFRDCGDDPIPTRVQNLD